MNQPIFLSKIAFNLLRSNLLEIEEGMDEIIANFFIEPSKEAGEIRGLLKEYISKLKSILRDITTVETTNNEMPFVVVGSEVMVENVESGATYCYKLVTSFKNTADFDEVSIFSPMGKALLLRKVNDSFIVDAPGGNYKYKILAVRINT